MWQDDKSQRIVWVDCEMTGLDHNVDRLIEVAVLVTNKDLEVVAEGPNLIIHQPKEVMDGMDEWNTDHHGRSGLTKSVLESKLSVEEADQIVHDFVREWVPKGKCPLGGNSVGQDAKFLEKYMPKFYSHLHYRIIDVSTVKELARRWFPEEKATKPKKELAHRALGDILESIEELKYYRNNVFKKSTY